MHQAHSRPDDCEDWTTPLAAIVYVDGKLSIDAKGNTVKCSQKGEFTHIHSFEWSGEPILDAWNSFVIRYRFSPTSPDGILELWFNDEKIVSESNLVLSYNNDFGPFLKYGVYYFEGKSDYNLRRIYFDNISIGKSYDEVNPERGWRLLPFGN